MWKATLKQVAENQTPSDQIDIEVVFENIETGKIIEKGYNLKAAGITDIQDVKNTIQYEIDRLNKFDEIRGMLLSRVGKDFNDDKLIGNIK